MKGKTLLLTMIAVAIIIICFVVYYTYSNTEVESEQLAVVFPMDEMISVEMFEETINDLYKETLVESETTEEESDTQEIVEAGEIGSDVENEEILSKDESTENPSGGEDLTATQPTPAPKAEGGSSDNTGGGSGLTPEQQAAIDAARAALAGSTGTSTNITPAGENSGSNHGITMAQ